MASAKTKKSKNLTVKLIKSTKFNRLLESMRERYVREKESDDLVVPYVLLCALALESKLNDKLMDHAHGLSRESPKTLEDAFCSMTFKGKLNAVVPILTNGRYRINQENIVYQRLVSLIGVRNQLAHARSQYEDIEYGHDESPPEIPTILNLPKSYFDRVDDLTLDASRTFTPLEYHEAIERLDKWFFRRCPNRLSHIDLVISVGDA